MALSNHDVVLDPKPTFMKIFRGSSCHVHTAFVWSGEFTLPTGVGCECEMNVKWMGLKL